jgi:mannose-6-phosphate isomerase-like protein (cupin superfamily)/quinol monooxygenase YgiN
MVARDGQVERAAGLLLDAADKLRGNPGCELYLVNRQHDQPDVIWVTELWRDQAALEAARDEVRERDDAKAVMETVAEFEMVELDLLGGKGARAEPAEPYTIVAIDETKDFAAEHGLSEFQEARFPTEALSAADTGLGHFRLKAGKRQPFAHRHQAAEEVYVVLSGSGRVKLDDEIGEIKRLDAIRVAPGVSRQFEAGPDGLELLAFGTRHAGDAEIVKDFWTD